MNSESDSDDLLKFTVEIIAAHVSNNTLPASELPQLISQVHSSLSDTGKSMGTRERPTPAVSIKKSITPDYLVCLEDGKKLKMLKRHIKTAYDLTPGQYRERWGLAADYPMVAPNYAKRRSNLAKEIGLGKRGSILK
ncbi:MAG: MucR family transcriptional regulator [Alphaproteobacteria bacterium]|nr:MucR family transcriptional regulator [Alphaproteobacteria bacterium]|tara:strand:- start:20 stop:430 length:411 start_codon:yes stop_codon:yes gene_type:complete